MTRLALLATVVAGSITWTASADTLYASYVVLGQGDVLATIDTGTGIVTTIGSLGSIGVQAIAWDSSSSTLFAFASIPDTLVAIDPLTADVAFVGASQTSAGIVGGLAYDPVRDKLYGAESLGVPLGAQMSEIDRVTGAFTPIGDPTPYGSAMTFHPASGEIFVADPFPGSLGRWNPDTSLVTELGPIAPMHSLAWSTTDSALYGIGDAPGARGETNTLYTIDPATGATINTITLSESHYYAALTAIPAPGVFAVVVVCGSTVATRRRRSTGR